MKISLVRLIVLLLSSMFSSFVFVGCSEQGSATPSSAGSDIAVTTPSVDGQSVEERRDRWNLPKRLAKYRGLIEDARAASNDIVEHYTPATAGQIDDLNADIYDMLSKLPGVISVVKSESIAPTQRIIHLIGHSLPTKEELLTGASAMADIEITPKQLDMLSEDYLQQIELMQVEQMVVLRCLIEHHGLRRVFAEGVTQANLQAYQEKVLSLRTPELGIGDELEVEYLDLLKLGPAGQLLARGELQEVLPIDDDFLSRQKTVQREWVASTDRYFTIQPGKSVIELDFQVHAVLNRGDFGFIMGGDYDLTEYVNRISGGKCQYLRVKTKMWSNVWLLEPNVWGAYAR